MNCELCYQENPTNCEHTKNAYCLIFLKQAEKDIKQFGPKHYKTLADLIQGDTFRYKGSDENDWHVVSKIDDEKIYYAGYLPDVPQSNYRVEKC